MSYFLEKEFNFKLKLFLFNFFAMAIIAFVYNDVIESLFFNRINFIFFYKNIFDVFLTKFLIGLLISLEVVFGILVIDLFYTFSSSLSIKEYKTYKNIFYMWNILYLVYCIFLQKYFFEATSLFFLEMTDSKFIYISKLDIVYLLYKINIAFFILAAICAYILHSGSFKKRTSLYFLLMCSLTFISPPDVFHFSINTLCIICLLEIFVYRNYVLSVLGFEPKTT